VVFKVDMHNIHGNFGGYPFILYGRHPWGGMAVGQSPIFPLRVRNMEKLVCVADYELSPYSMCGNVAFDLWLTHTAEPQDPSGGLEVMIWLWRRNQEPLGGEYYEAVFPIKVNDREVNVRFKVYVNKNTNPWKVVTFMLPDDRLIEDGKVEINLLSFIEYAISKVGESEDLYLEGIEFGTEFTQSNQNYVFTLKEFDIQQTLTSTQQSLVASFIYGFVKKVKEIFFMFFKWLS